MKLQDTSFSEAFVKKNLSILSLWFCSLLLVSLAGCVSMDTTGSTGVARNQPGIYHKVQKGETLWRIAKSYQVDIDDIIRSNNIPNVAHLEENQLIFIPGATAPVKVPAATTVTATSSGKPLEAVKDDFGWPVRGRVARYFGEQRGSYLNRGIAIEVMEGQPVVASRQGKVVFADYLAGYSYTVILDHLDGYFSVYGLNSKLLVNFGDNIAKGDKIALTGRKGNTPMLYFEIRRNAKAENPLYFLPKI